MCDTILCERCLSDADTDLTIYTNNYEYLCESCHEIDEGIESLDSDISELLDVLEIRPSDYGAALELKQKQDDLNKKLETW